ncbi:MAG: V-type ATPase subunit, partial [Nitrososphaerales archaeon]
SAESVSDAITLLKSTRYSESEIATSDEIDEVQRMEKHFERMVYQEASKPYLWNMKSLGTVLGSVKLIEMEVKNLSKIAYGVETKTPADVTLSRLTFLK